LENINCNFLTKLGLSHNNIDNIDVLRRVKFSQLEILALSNNKIKDISILSELNLRFLRELRLSKNEIADISILKEVKFPNLKCLVLSNNYITNIDALEDGYFPILLELRLSNNKIDDASSLKSSKFCKIIKKLFLSNNNISNLDPFVNCSCPSCLYDSNELNNINSISVSRGRGEARGGMSRGGYIGRIGYEERNFHIHFKDLKELNIAGNIINKRTNKDEIEFLKEHINKFVI